VTTSLSILALMSGAGLEGVAAAAFAGHVTYAAAVLRLIVRESGITRPDRFVISTLLPLVWCAIAVGVADLFVSDQSVTAALLGFGVYLLLLLPLVGVWRTEWRRLQT
jgi:hypothetical protein